MPCLHSSLRWRACQQCLILIGSASMVGTAMGLPYTATAAMPLAQLPATDIVTLMVSGLMAVARIFTDDTQFHKDFITAAESVPEFGSQQLQLLCPAEHANSTQFVVNWFQGSLFIVTAVADTHPQVFANLYPRGEHSVFLPPAPDGTMHFGSLPEYLSTAPTTYTMMQASVQLAMAQVGVGGSDSASTYSGGNIPASTRRSQQKRSRGQSELRTRRENDNNCMRQRRGALENHVAFLQREQAQQEENERALAHDASKCPLGLPIYSVWQGITKRLFSWNEDCSKTFHPHYMQACVNCGVTQLGGINSSNFKKTGLNDWPDDIFLYGYDAYPHLLECMLVDDTQSTMHEGSQFWACSNCCHVKANSLLREKPYARCKYHVACPPEYKQAILKQDPVSMQLLSIVDTSVQFTERMYGFAQGKISNTPLLCAPLITYDTNERPRVNANSYKNLLDIFAVQKLANPIIKNFATMLERPNPHNGVPFLNFSDVQNIVDNAISRDMRDLPADGMPKHMGIAFEIPNSVQGLKPEENTRAAAASFINVGEAQRRIESAPQSGGSPWVPSELQRDILSAFRPGHVPFPLQNAYSEHALFESDPGTSTSDSHCMRLLYDVGSAQIASTSANLSANLTSTSNVSIPNYSIPSASSVIFEETGPLGVCVDRVQPVQVCLSQLYPHAPLPQMSLTHGQQLNLEMCLFPFLFPHAKGAYSGIRDGNNYSFGDYCCMRMKIPFSQWTLYQPYLLLMFQISQVHDMATKYQNQALEKDVAHYRAILPDVDDSEIWRRVAKTGVPPSFVGSPSWHRAKLKDLQCMVQNYGMPSLFLTLTSDEVSESKFPEVEAMDQNFLAKIYDPEEPHKFRRAPVENARMFHHRCMNFLEKHIFVSDGLLGNVTHSVIRYECQNRGSIHAHIMLWQDEPSYTRVKSEITASIPANVKLDKQHLPPNDISRYEMPNCPAQTTLLKHVCRKQMHTCKPIGQGCRLNGHCCMGFPYAEHLAREASINPSSVRWVYHRPSYDCRNVVPRKILTKFGK